MDKVEDYIKSNRDAFKHIEPLDTDLMWSEFENRRNEKKNKVIQLWNVKWTSIAASLALLISAYTCFHHFSSQSDSFVINDLENIDHSLVGYQESMLSSLETYDESLQNMGVEWNDYPDVLESLDQLERLAESYQRDLKKYGPQPKILKSILKCTKQKIRIYEILINQIELKRYHEKGTNNTNI